ncbi:hypothetical protein MLD38_025529 [Melastoma candidum]|uniref:Uncharacterized protein n=1 Tax=Melastoma candidum TaxID=119954 RepID=A0ACB9NZ59_9MYRT|nr:hypothetical protein MLD38_025529 [Melastoma candidum]
MTMALLITMNQTSSTSPSSLSLFAPSLGPFLTHVRSLEILFACSVFIVLHSLFQRNRHGLLVWPLIGMAPSLISGLRGNIYELISEVVCRQHGTFLFMGPWFTNLNCVITSDPRNLEHLLKSRFANFPKGRYFRDTVRDLLGDGIFNADDETWQRQRKIASIEFHSAQFRQLTNESLLELVHSRLLPVLEESLQESSPLDLQDVLLRLTFDNVSMIAFGVEPGCLHQGLPEIPIARAFEDATEATVLRFITPTFIWKAMKYLDVGPERILGRCIKDVNEFTEQVIKTRKVEFAINSESGEKKSDILTVFMGMRDEEGQPYSDKFLRDICVNFILAGGTRHQWHLAGSSGYWTKTGLSRRGSWMRFTGWGGRGRVTNSMSGRMH